MKDQPARLPLSRPPLERMLRIHQALSAGKFPNATTLARELEVSTKSIQRDIEFMRDRLALPIEYNAARMGYFYNGEVSSFPTMQITEGELVALVIAEKALEQYRGTQFEKPLLSAIRKIEQSLPDTISVNLADVEQTISFRTRAEQILNLEIFDALAKATANRRQLELAYRKLGGRDAEPRVVDPYHLANINGEWYLFAFDHGRKDIRTFVPSRVQKVRQTGKTFSRPEKFSLEKRLSGSFGVHSGEGEYEVVLRFNARSADLVREKKWHESQQLRELKGRGVELKLKLSSLVEIERWILSWGGDVKVVKPRELAESVRNAAKAILNS
jgi:proteasome accessory factor B